MKAAAFAALAAVTSTAWLVVACLPSFDCYEAGSCGGNGTSSESGADGVVPPGDAGDGGIEADVSSGGGHRWRRAIQIHAGDAGFPAGYSVRVTGIDVLTDGGHAQANFGNVYVVGPDGGQVDRIVDPAPTPSLWFAAQATLAAGAEDDTTYALEYGDLDAGGPLADGSAVFVTYDDFAGSALPPSWESQGYVTVSNGTVTLGPDVDAAFIARDNDGAAAPDNRTGIGGIGIEIRATTPTAVPPGSLWLGFQVPPYTGCPHQIWQIGSVFAPDYCDPTQVVGMAGTPIDAGLAGQTHLFQVFRTFTSTHFLIDDQDEYDLPQWMDRTHMYPIVKNEDYPGAVSVSMVRTRYVLEDDPTVTLGPETALP